MEQTFHYNTRSASFAQIILAIIFSAVGVGLYSLGGVFEVAAKVFLAVASYFWLVGLIYLAVPKIRYVQISADELSIWFGIPWAQKTIKLPISSIVSVVVCKSPFHYNQWTRFGTLQHDEEYDVLRLTLSPALPSSQVEEIQRIKRNPLPIYHFAVAREGAEFYIKETPKEGLAALHNAIQQHMPSNKSPS
jgi:hypothetical protein